MLISGFIFMAPLIGCLCLTVAELLDDSIPRTPTLLTIEPTKFTTKICPHCNAKIVSTSNTCPNCGTSFNNSIVKHEKAVRKGFPNTAWTCSKCGYRNMSYQDSCSSCYSKREE